MNTPKTDEFILSCVRTDYNWQILARHLENELNAAKELIREIRDNEVNAVDEATKFLRDYPIK